MEKKFLKHFNIAGTSYWEAVDVFMDLKIGSQLELKAEPENKYDPEAVAIYYEQKKLGYIPKKMNYTISMLLQSGYREIFDVRINRLKPDGHPEEQIGAVVRIVKREW